jgi:hypothetical protein
MNGGSAHADALAAEDADACDADPKRASESVESHAVLLVVGDTPEGVEVEPPRPLRGSGRRCAGRRCDAIP